MKKIGGNEMNRKVVILLVAMVATILPAVAVADVMITGSASLTLNGVPDQFLVGPGPNYGPVQNMNLFNWTSVALSESEDIGTMTLNYTSNLTINEINVLQVSNFKIDSSSANNWFNITVDRFTGLSSNAQILMYVSTAPLSFDGADLQTSTGTFIVHSLVETTNGPTAVYSFQDVTSSTTLYIGFVIGPIEPTNGPFPVSPTPSTFMYFSLTSVGS
jgi:hypothetical protein